MKALIERAVPPHAAGETWRPALVRLLLLAHYALFGLVIGVQGVGWSDVKQRIGLGDGAFGLAFVVTPLIAFVLLLVGRVIWRPFGRRQRAVAGLLVIAGALLFLAPAADLTALVWCPSPLVERSSRCARSDGAGRTAPHRPGL